MNTYDLIVIGSGTAAQVAASRVRKAGRSVAVIDHRPFGGTCALRGCDPKKMLVSGAEAVNLARRMRGHGVSGDLHIDWKDLISFRRTFTDPVPRKHEENFGSQGIDAFHGTARFTGSDRVAVGDHTFRGHQLLIAKGARPAVLDSAGASHLITSDAFMELDRLPGRIAMVGGGYIAAEFSHIAASAGARVTALQREARILPTFDSEVVGWLMEKFAEIGVDIRIRKRARTPQGEAIVTADLVVHAAGRTPDVTELDLSEANVAVANGKLQLNDFLQSVSNPIVYAAGDAAAKGPPLTPVSSHGPRWLPATFWKAIVTSRTIAAYRASRSRCPRSRPSSFPKVPPGRRCQNCVSNPQAFPTGTRPRGVAESVYGYKTLVDEGSGRIPGAHLVGPYADEVINLFALAIRHDLTVEDLKSTMFAYPAGASDISSML